MYLDILFWCAVILFVIFFTGALLASKRGDKYHPWMFKARKTEIKWFYFFSLILLIVAIVTAYLQYPVWTCTHLGRVYSWQQNFCSINK